MSKNLRTIVKQFTRRLARVREAFEADLRKPLPQPDPARARERARWLTRLRSQLAEIDQTSAAAKPLDPPPDLAFVVPDGLGPDSPWADHTWSSRVQMCLTILQQQQPEIQTLRDVAMHTRNDITKIRGVGRRSAAEIEGVLRCVGLAYNNGRDPV